MEERRIVKEFEKPFIIAGPCAAESRHSVLSCASEIKELVTGFRASLWKPRTEPGFDGVGFEGIPWLAEVSEMGLIVATEVMTPEQTEKLATDLAEKSKSSRFIFWLGSRNQNHLIQKSIAEMLNGSANVFLMVKNQPWEDERHWFGIIEHILQSGFPAERLILCHRGFHPGRLENPCEFRNMPNWEMAMKIKEKSGLPMIIDPSHIGGEAEKVILAAEQANKFNFDGLMVEVNLDPVSALTDKKQQLNIKQFKNLLNKL